MVDKLNNFAFEVSKVAREVGTDGTLGGQANVENVEGKWAELTNNVNVMAANLTAQVRGISDVTQAIARGDLSQKIEVEAQGEVLKLKVTMYAGCCGHQQQGIVLINGIATIWSNNWIHSHVS